MEIEAKGFSVNLEGAGWRKSTRSGPYSDNCVEVAFVGGAVALRDSKDKAGPVIVVFDGVGRAPVRIGHVAILNG